MRKVPFLPILIVLTFSVTCAVTEVVKTSYQGVREYAEERQGRSAYGLYLGGHKVGWGVLEWILGEHEGRKVLVEKEDLEIKVQLFGETEKMSTTSQAIYELDGEGELIFVEERTTDNDEVMVHTVVRRDGKHVIRALVGGQETERIVPLSKQTIAQDMHLNDWVTRTAVKDDKFVIHTINLDHPEGIDTEEKYTFLERWESRWGGVPVLRARLQMEIFGVTGELEVLSTGAMVKGNMGPFEVRLEEESFARNYEAPKLDMMLEVEVDRKLGDPSLLDSLVLQCSGTGGYEFPVSRRQGVRTGERGAAILELRRDYVTGEKRKLDDRERKRFLQGTPFIQIDHPRIRELSKEIVKHEKDPVAAAGRLQAWVFANLETSYKHNAVHSLQVLDNMAGDCTEHSMLFLTLARASGIPARSVMGLAYAETDRPFFAWHQWAEIHDGGQWITVDPTWGQVFVDASHIRTWTEQIEEDYSTMELMFEEGFGCKVLDTGSEAAGATREN